MLQFIDVISIGLPILSHMIQMKYARCGENSCSKPLNHTVQIDLFGIHKNSLKTITQLSRCSFLIQNPLKCLTKHNKKGKIPRNPYVCMPSPCVSFGFARSTLFHSLYFRTKQSILFNVCLVIHSKCLVIILCFS